MTVNQDAQLPVASPAALCLSCGLCCDGTLFTRVTVKPDDVAAPLVAGGIAIRTLDMESSFAQPCSGHSGGCCQVYADRPASCRSYQCLLLERFRAGTASWSEAQQRIGRVRSLKRELVTLLAPVMPDAGRLPLAAVQQRAPSHSALAANRQLLDTWVPIQLQLAAILHVLHTHFQKPDEPVQPRLINRE